MLHSVLKVTSFKSAWHFIVICMYCKQAQIQIIQWFRFHNFPYSEKKNPTWKYTLRIVLDVLCPWIESIKQKPYFQSWIKTYVTPHTSCCRTPRSQSCWRYLRNLRKQTGHSSLCSCCRRTSQSRPGSCPPPCPCCRHLYRIRDSAYIHDKQPHLIFLSGKYGVRNTLISLAQKDWWSIFYVLWRL